MNIEYQTPPPHPDPHNCVRVFVLHVNMCSMNPYQTAYGLGPHCCQPLTIVTSSVLSILTLIMVNIFMHNTPLQVLYYINLQDYSYMQSGKQSGSWISETI